MAGDDDEVWLTLADVPPGSCLGRQIQLIRDFLAYRLGPENFRQLWYEAQLQKIACGDQLRDATRKALSRIENLRAG